MNVSVTSVTVELAVCEFWFVPTSSITHLHQMMVGVTAQLCNITQKPQELWVHQQVCCM